MGGKGQVQAPSYGNISLTCKYQYSQHLQINKQGPLYIHQLLLGPFLLSTSLNKASYENKNINKHK